MSVLHSINAPLEYDMTRTQGDVEIFPTEKFYPQSVNNSDNTTTVFGDNRPYFQNPIPLNIYVKVKLNIRSYFDHGLNATIEMGRNGKKFTIIIFISTIVTIESERGLPSIKENNNGLGIKFGNTKSGPKIIKITLNKESINGLISGIDYELGDTYELNLISYSEGISVTITRALNDKIKNKQTSKMLSLNNQIEVPQLFINGQTLIDGSDIGQIIFTIRDALDVTYYGKDKLKYEQCKTYFINSDQLTETIFNKPCPKIVTVLKGKDNTAFDKVALIYNSSSKEIVGPSFKSFYLKVIFYGMLKYILSRVLYGEFNINYLLGSYNDKLLLDLSNSRFCKSLLILDEYDGFIRYFKYKL